MDADISKLPKYVFRRASGSYRYKRNVPAALREVIPKATVYRQLGTTYDEAIRRLPVVHAEIEALFDLERKTPNSRRAVNIVRERLGEWHADVFAEGVVEPEWDVTDDFRELAKDLWKTAPKEIVRQIGSTRVTPEPMTLHKVLSDYYAFKCEDGADDLHALSADCEAIACRIIDDTTVKLLQKGNGRGKNKTKTARLWVYARKEDTWASGAPPAVWYQFSTSRGVEYPSQHLTTYEGFTHADAYAGYNDAYRTERVKEMACMAHVRREFFTLWESVKLPVAGEAVLRIRKLYDVETQARFLPASERVALRQEYAKPIFDDLEVWFKEQLGKISSKTPLAKAIKYALARLPKARPYLDDGFLELDNNTAERAVRPVAVGRKNYLFMGSEAGCKSVAIAYTLIETAKMNKVNPEAWLAWVLERIQEHSANRIHDLMPWAYQDTIDAKNA